MLGAYDSLGKTLVYYFAVNSAVIVLDDEVGGASLSAHANLVESDSD